MTALFFDDGPPGGGGHDGPGPGAAGTPGPPWVRGPGESDHDYLLRVLGYADLALRGVYDGVRGLGRREVEAHCLSACLATRAALAMLRAAGRRGGVSLGRDCDDRRRRLGARAGEA